MHSIDVHRSGLPKNRVQLPEQLFFRFVGIDMEIRVAAEHRTELCLRRAVEDIAQLSVVFAGTELIADAEGRTGALCDEEIGGAKPGHILVIDVLILDPLLACIEIRRADMLGEYDVRLLNMPDDVPIERGILTTTTDRTCEINFFIYFKFSIF